MGVRARRLHLAAAVVAAVAALPAGAWAATPDQRFREANELARGGDYPRAIAAYRELAATGHESASLYWNWAQAASSRGAPGEALWALLRARELDPGDRAVRRDISKLRESLNLDPAEIAPEPLVAAARLARRFRLDLLALGLLAMSLGAHALARLRPGSQRWAQVAWLALALGLVASAGPAVGALARPTGAVVRRNAPLLDAASPTAEAIGTLREGEVVPILETSGAWLRVEDASGARGWAHHSDVQRIDRPPVVAAETS
jgi:Bacterial SH3 domain